MNCAGQMPKSYTELLPIFRAKIDDFFPDVFIIGLQEIVALTAKSIFLFKDKQKLDEWHSLIMAAIQHILKEKLENKMYKEEEQYYMEYVPISKTLVGLYLFVAFKRQLVHTKLIKQKDVFVEKVKSGMYGNTGNKGAVLIRFVIGDQSFMIINCHLMSGRRRDQ